MIYGLRASNMGSLKVRGSNCGYCKNSNSHFITVFGAYFHIFWLPIFPLWKKTTAECTHCRRTLNSSEYDNKLIHLSGKVISRVKRPFWHWSGLMFFGFLILLVSFIPRSSKENLDGRYQLLQRDVSLMVKNPSLENDSIAFKLKNLYESYNFSGVNINKFEYRTQSHDNKVLVLVKIPDIKYIKKSDRYTFIEIIESLIESDSYFENKEVYIGIHGWFSMMLIQTPNVYKNGRLISEEPLYEYYENKIKKANMMEISISPNKKSLQFISSLLKLSTEKVNIDMKLIKESTITEFFDKEEEGEDFYYNLHTIHILIEQTSNTKNEVIIALDWKHPLDEFKTVIEHLVKNNYSLNSLNLNSKYDNESKYAITGTEVFRDFDEDLKKYGLCIGFIETGGDEYMLFVHKIENKLKIYKLLKENGLNYFDSSET